MRTANTDALDRIIRHARSCLYCRSVPVDRRPICGQLISLEADLSPALQKMIRARRRKR